MRDEYLVTTVKLTQAVLIVVGMRLSFTTRKALVNGLSIGLLLIGAIGFIIDGFAHQRVNQCTAALRSPVQL